MNCKQLLELLSSGGPLSAEAQAHIGSCSGCRMMLEALEQPSAAAPPARVSAIEQLVVTNLTPVRPLPSNRRLTAVALAIAGVLAVGCAFPFGYLALHSLSAAQMIAYYSLIAVIGIVLAIAVVQDMIPGAKRTISRPVLIAGAFVLLAVATPVLFPVFSAPRFVPRGIPCLRLGILSAVIAGTAMWVLLRKGFLTTPVETGCLAGSFAGLTGFAVLALHCPIQETPHILTWHLGAMAIAGAAGTLLGVSLEYLARFRKVDA